MLRRSFLAASAATLFAAPAAGQQDHGGAKRAGDLTIQQPWTRAAGQGATAAGFMEISNRGSAADRLLSASSPVARAMELHSMIRDGDVMRMRAVDAIEIRTGQTVTLRPGGFHLMLIGLSQPLRQGETVPVTLRFERAGEVQVTFPVQAAGAREPTLHRH